MESMTEEQFAEQLDDLLTDAHRAGVSVEGGWSCDVPDEEGQVWGVEITRVEYL